MRRLRVLIVVAIIAALGLGAWKLLRRPLAAGVTSTAPAFTAQLYGSDHKVAFPDDYAGKWVWLVFSGEG